MERWSACFTGAGEVEGHPVDLELEYVPALRRLHDQPAVLRHPDRRGDFERLQIAALARRLEAARLEVSGDVLRRLVGPRLARLPTGQLVAGQIFHVAQQGVGIEGLR